MRILLAVLILGFPFAAQAEDEFGERFIDEAPVALDESRLWDIAPAAGDPRPETPRVQILEGGENFVRIRPQRGASEKEVRIRPDAPAGENETKAHIPAAPVDVILE